MVEVVNSSCIWVYSDMHEYVNCIFIVQEDDKEKAVKVLNNACSTFLSKGEGWSFENWLKDKLIEANIAYNAFYADKYND